MSKRSSRSAELKGRFHHANPGRAEDRADVVVKNASSSKPKRRPKTSTQFAMHPLSPTALSPSGGPIEDQIIRGLAAAEPELRPIVISYLHTKADVDKAVRG